MGRRAGVTKEQTRADVLDAAAEVFATRGYDGASISGIAAAAGVTKGAIYGHYPSKAELFIAVIREFGEREFRVLAGGVDEHGEPVSLDAFVRRAGNSYARPRSPVGALLVEAIVASRRHGEIAEMIRGWLLEGEGAMGAAIDQAQGEGLVTADVGATELARFSTMVALGARLAGVLDLPPVDEARWSTVIDELIGGLIDRPDL
ncbi:MAG: TetR/AcrR family transcriptional regulator [Actinobacteria bacterium]|nr:TetR/AcrR family transcriptional regulator [Actinomycetota bacterium]